VRRMRLSACCGGLAVVWLGVWSLPVASFALRAGLENQYPPVPMESVPRVEAIVVLGGGIAPPALGEAMPNLEARADRVWYAARLFKAGKAPLIVLSGGSDPQYSASSEAEAMRELLLEMGVDRQAMLLESRSRNTTENARFTAELLAEQEIGPVLLVTSALHMPRAVALFEAEGIMVVPAATDHEVRPLPGWRAWTPDAAALEGSGRAMKEWVGRWVGR